MNFRVKSFVWVFWEILKEEERRRVIRMEGKVFIWREVYWGWNSRWTLMFLLLNGQIFSRFSLLSLNSHLFLSILTSFSQFSLFSHISLIFRSQSDFQGLLNVTNEFIFPNPPKKSLNRCPQSSFLISYLKKLQEKQVKEELWIF